MTGAGKVKEEGTKILLSRKHDLGKLIFCICNRGPGSARPMNGVLWHRCDQKTAQIAWKGVFLQNVPGTNELKWKLIKAWLMVQRRTPSKLDVPARKPKRETISLVDHKPPKIVNDLRLISLETNLACYKEDFVLSALHKDREQMTKTMVIFKRGAIFLCCIRCDPIPPQTSVQRLAHTRNVTTCCFQEGKALNSASGEMSDRLRMTESIGLWLGWSTPIISLCR